MKKISFMLCLSLCCIALVGCGEKKEPQNPDNGNNNPPAVEVKDSEKFKQEYEKSNPKEGENGVTMDIPSNNTIEYKNVDEILDILKNKTGIIYFGFPDCPWCRNILPILIETAKENQLPIYYYNPRTSRTNGDDDYNRLKTALSDYLQSNEDGEKVLYVPDVYFVKDGKVIGHHIGSVEDQVNPYTPMTDEQQLALTKIYQDYITKIK